MKNYLVILYTLLASCNTEPLTPEKAKELLTQTYKYPAPVTGFIDLSYDERNAETWFSVDQLEASGLVKYDTVANKKFPLIPTEEFKKYIIPESEGGAKGEGSVVYREATARLDSIIKVKLHPTKPEWMLVVFTERVSDPTPAGLFFDNYQFTSMPPTNRYDAVFKKSIFGWTYDGCFTCSPHKPQGLPNNAFGGFAAPG